MRKMNDYTDFKVDYQTALLMQDALDAYYDHLEQRKQETDDLSYLLQASIQRFQDANTIRREEVS
jgi:hypothetical protein